MDRKQHKREYYLKNKERLDAYGTEWREKNKEHLAQVKHEYYLKHKLQTRISRAKSSIKECCPEGEERDKEIARVTKIIIDKYSKQE